MTPHSGWYFERGRKWIKDKQPYRLKKNKCLLQEPILCLIKEDTKNPSYSLLKPSVDCFLSFDQSDDKGKPIID